MLPSDMNLQIGKIKMSSSFNIGTNLKINFDDNKYTEEDKSDVKPNKSDIKSIKEHKQNKKMIKTKPYINEITDEEKTTALILGVTAIFKVSLMFK